tara:strand:- start:564 stop:1610 length:1047 start_codon:yes stop_codon:yes gene_type:complete
MQKYDYAVIIGRFQPIHKGHVRLIVNALSKAKRVIIGVGSANSSVTPRNPFTYEERASMIEMELGDYAKRVTIEPLNDSLYTDSEWSQQVRDMVHNVAVSHCMPDATIGLSGFEKDSTSYYLRFFPEWADLTVKEPLFEYNSTDIRELFYEHYLQGKTYHLTPDMYFGEDLAISDTSALWTRTDLQDRLFSLAKEWDFNRKYDPSKYDVNVLTVDAVVLCNGHILLVKRKHEPGKGLLALPGGHLNKDETLKEAVLRELREETKIDLSNRVLERSIADKEIFDHPKRSERARVITTAFFINLTGEDKLPKVKGGDDAAKAMWVPLYEIEKNKMFEDHFDIATKLTQGQ